jgi:hypothetical protein
MARRKKKAAPRRRRSGRKMGAMGGSFIMNVLGLAAGAVGARILTSSPKVLPNLDPKIKSAGVIAVGLYFPKLVKGNLGKSIGDGMVAAGGLGLLQAANVLGQIESAMDIPASVMAGDGLSLISGYSEDNLSVISGQDEEVYNY